MSTRVAAKRHAAAVRQLAAERQGMLDGDPIMAPPAIYLLTSFGPLVWLQVNGKSVYTLTADSALTLGLRTCDECMVADDASQEDVDCLPKMGTSVTRSPVNVVGRIVNYATLLPAVLNHTKVICQLPGGGDTQQLVDNQAASRRLAVLFFCVVKVVRTRLFGAGRPQTYRSCADMFKAFAAAIAAELARARASVDVFRPGALALLVKLCCANSIGEPPLADVVSTITSLVHQYMPRAQEIAATLPRANYASMLGDQPFGTSLLAATIDARDVPTKLADLGVEGPDADVAVLRFKYIDDRPFNPFENSPATVLFLAAMRALKDEHPGPYAGVKFGVHNHKTPTLHVSIAGIALPLAKFPTLEAAEAVRKVLRDLPHVFAVLVLLHRVCSAPAGDRVRALAQAEIDLGLPPLTGRLLEWAVARLEANPAERASFVAALEPARVHARARMAAALPRDQFIVLHRKAYDKYVDTFTEATGSNVCPRCKETCEFVGATGTDGNKSEIDGPGGKVGACLECSFYYNRPEVKLSAEKAQDKLVEKRKRKRAGMPPVIAPHPKFGFTRLPGRVPRPA